VLPFEARTAGGLVVVGSADGSLYGSNRSDGTQRWKFDTKGR